MKNPAILLVLLVGVAILQNKCIAQLPGDQQHRNLFVNPSFEKGMEPWELEAIHKIGKASIDPEQKHEGHPSLRIENAQADNTHTFQTVTVKPFTRYRMEGWIKATRIKNEGDEKGLSGASLSIWGTGQRTAFISSAQDWRHVFVEFDSGEKAELKLGPHVGFLNKKSSGTAWFADLSLTELGPGSHLTTKPKQQ